MTTTIDRDAVRQGDRITWRTINGGHEASGEVQWATREAVHVLIPGHGIYPVEWARVESHERPGPDLSALETFATFGGGRFADGPFAVYARWSPDKPEYVTRGHDRESAERTARRLAADGARVHVSLDTCG